MREGVIGLGELIERGLRGGRRGKRGGRVGGSSLHSLFCSFLGGEGSHVLFGCVGPDGRIWESISRERDLECII